MKDEVVAIGGRSQLHAKSCVASQKRRLTDADIHSRLCGQKLDQLTVARLTSYERSYADLARRKAAIEEGRNQEAKLRRGG